MKSLLSALVMGLFVCLGIQAQTLQPGLLSTAGGSGTSAAGSLNWSVGELVVQTLTSAGPQLTQGFHQNGRTLTPVYEAGSVFVGLEVFPNPSSQQLMLRQEGAMDQDLHYELFNLYGQSKKGGRLSGQLTSIDLSTLPAQIYLLKVFSNPAKQVAVFKIQKID